MGNSWQRGVFGGKESTNSTQLDRKEKSNETIQVKFVRTKKLKTIWLGTSSCLPATERGMDPPKEDQRWCLNHKSLALGTEVETAKDDAAGRGMREKSILSWANESSCLPA
jgi:hypothetical protein